MATSPTWGAEIVFVFVVSKGAFVVSRMGGDGRAGGFTVVMDNESLGKTVPIGTSPRQSWIWGTGNGAIDAGIVHIGSMASASSAFG